MGITLGRYTDAFKAKDKTDLWTECEKLFEQKNYFDSYTAFFNYLKDKAQDNLSFTRENGVIKFQFYQGSKLVRGVIDEKKVTAEAEVAAFEKAGVSFMRRLMEMNFTLYYSRFAVKDNVIYIKFDSGVIDGSPRKLYYALKELAIRADKQDDVLLKDFPLLKPAETYTTDIAPEEKEIMYKYYQKWISNALQRVSGLKEDTFSGAISYLLLNTLYKIDFLISPQGSLQNDMEAIHYGYFARDNKPFGEKNKVMADQIQKLLDRPKEKVLSDLYRVKATFGIANPAPHPAVIDVINNNSGNVKWYVDNKYEDIAAVIYEYMAGYCLFSYGLAKADIELFRLLLNITTQDYFNEMGFTEKYYDDSTKKFNEELIKGAVEGIIKAGAPQYPELKFKTENLKFDSMLNFLKSFMNEILSLNYNTE